MDQYAKKAAMSKIQGYFVRRVNEDSAITFARAKKETAYWMKKRLDDVESITFEDYQAYYKEN